MDYSVIQCVGYLEDIIVDDRQRCAT